MAPLHEAARSQDAPAVTDDDALRRRDAKSHQGEVLPKVAPQLCERSNQSGGRGLEQESVHPASALNPCVRDARKARRAITECMYTKPTRELV